MAYAEANVRDLVVARSSWRRVLLRCRAAILVADLGTGCCLADDEAASHRHAGTGAMLRISSSSAVFVVNHTLEAAKADAAAAAAVVLARELAKRSTCCDAIFEILYHCEFSSVRV